MRLLIVGGTSFVGRAITNAAISAGHEVTVLNRGLTPSELPPSVIRLVGDRHGDLSALSSVNFDATIDCIAYQRRDVEALAEALGDRGGHHIQISSISAYQDPITFGGDESTPLLELGDVDPNSDVGPRTYGILKAECERVARASFSSVGIIRPTFVIGSHDKTMRFPYWVARLKRGGVVAFPGPASNSLQWVDARDLGEFTVAQAVAHFTGSVHVLGQSPAIGFGEVLERMARHIAPAGTQLVEVDPSHLTDLSWYQKFPLWTGSEGATALAMSNAAALGLGLTLRSLEESVSDTEQWLGETWAEQWLSPAAEAELLSKI
jgi:2'-hydroxyisoflavone reductase